MSYQSEKNCLKVGKHRIWKFVHRTDYNYKTDILRGRNCDFTWLKITPDGTITVKGSHENGYAWDGCTPKLNMLHITWGNFDGSIFKFDEGDYKPYTYYASMIHDVLYQYKKCAPITRKEADLIFLEMLSKTGFMWRYIFYGALRLFGGIMGRWKFKSPTST